jgi:hypothetical protein
MSEIQNPVRIAAAIAELATDAVCEAWHYLDAVERLGAKHPNSPVGIQPLELRHALERPREDTEAMRALAHWARAGSRGLLAIVGKVGRGKTHAAACMAIDRAREHKSTLWITCASWPAGKEHTAERDDLIRRAQQAAALVLDDIGAGASSAPWVAEQLEPVLLARMGRFAPTVILSNKERADFTAWLGGRVDDRLAYAGGVVEVTGSESLRERDTTVLDERGRSPRWIASAKLVGLIGCELLDGRLVVGRALEEEAAARGNGVNVYAAELLGLDRDTVRARAADLERRDLELVRKHGLEADVSNGITWQSLAPALVDRIRKNQAEEIESAKHRADALTRARVELQPVTVDTTITVSPAQLAAAKSLASAWRVKVIDLGELGWTVRRVDGAVLAERVPSDALAYYHAALSVRARTEQTHTMEMEHA